MTYLGVFTSTDDHTWNRSVVIKPTTWVEPDFTINYVPIQMTANMNVVNAWNDGKRVYKYKKHH